MIDGETKVLGLYGFPVSHSLSPIIFNKTFEKMNAHRTYLPFAVKPEHLNEAVTAARALGFDGFNVTMPHKTRIVELLDDIENTARETGSVNAVSRNHRGLVGHNTDGEGAARAVVKTLSRESDITVLSRDPRQAKNIADTIPGHRRLSSGPLTKPVFEEFVATANLLVDATPVQTATLIRTLNSTDSKLPAGLWVFDLAYDPPLDKLPDGIRRVSALEMLVQQAALSYEIW